MSPKSMYSEGTSPAVEAAVLSVTDPVTTSVQPEGMYVRK